VGVETGIVLGLLEVDDLGSVGEDDDVDGADELMMELSVGDGEYDWVCVPPLLLHAARTTASGSATSAASTVRRAMFRLLPSSDPFLGELAA
jgi:hypothetical protein